MIFLHLLRWLCTPPGPIHYIHMMYCIDWFCMLNQPFIPRINPTWSWCIILFIYSLIWIAYISLSIFESVFIRDIDLIFIPWDTWMSGFGIGNTGFLEGIRKCSLLFYFRKYFVKDSLLNTGRIQQWSHLTFLCGKNFDYTFNLFVVSLFRFSISWVISVVCMCPLKNVSIYLGYLICFS